MAKGIKKFRCPNWSHEETLVLAEMKKDTFFKKKEGRVVWEQIAHTISTRFPDQKRSHDQCRRRWETLTKAYNHIEKYCMVTGQDHAELDEDELSSMKLDTAYRQDWYNIVKEVCSQRKRKEKGDCDLTTVKRSKRSDTCSSPSSVLPEPTLGRDSLCVTPPASNCEPVTTTIVNGQSSTRASSEAEKLSLEEENRWLHTMLREREIALILALEQLQQRGQVAQQDQVPQNSPVEVRAHLTEPLQDAVTDYREPTVERSSKAAEQDGIDCESMVTRSRSLSPEFFSDGQSSGAMILAGYNDPFDSSIYFSLPTTESWESLCTWINGIRIFFVRIASGGRRGGQECSTSIYQRRTQKGKEKTCWSYWPDPQTRNCGGTSRLHRRQKRIQVAWMTISWRCRN